MKRWLSFLVALILVLALAACDAPPISTPSAGSTPDTTTSIAPKLSGDEAKRIALQHAGSPAADALMHLRVSPELDDVPPHYEIEFETVTHEYDYEIHAETGAVLKAEKEMTDASATTLSLTTSSTTIANPTGPATAWISEARAKQIALEHAKLPEAAISRYIIERDVDDGVPEYEIEFIAAGFEYDYEIHGVKGTVLKVEKEPIE